MNVRIANTLWSNEPDDRAGTLLVLALHGRGSDERSMQPFLDTAASGVTVAAPRGPIDIGGGFTWFENAGIGRPIEASIQATAAGLFTWLDEHAGRHRGVAVLGFSGGAAMGAGLVLAEPARFNGAVLLSGTLPWDAGFATQSRRLARMPVLWSIDPQDSVIPRELVERSERWLREDSGAQLLERTYPGIGHATNLRQIVDVAGFLATL